MSIELGRGQRLRAGLRYAVGVTLGVVALASCAALPADDRRLLAAGDGSSPAATPTVTEPAAPAPSGAPPTGGTTPSVSSPRPRVVVPRPPARSTGVPRLGTGRLAVVPGKSTTPAGTGTVVRYLVEVEGGLPVEPAQVAKFVHSTLNDPRSWGRGGRTHRFVRVSSGPVRFRVTLASPRLADSLCHPLRTASRFSCWHGGRAVLNARRWTEGVPHYGGDLVAYRRYMVNHEVGHGLGHAHRGCPGRGLLAPVMVQQTKGLFGCRANPWPYPA